jgi:hypothetical protein
VLLYVKSLAIGLVAAVAGIAVQALVFSQSESSNDGSSGYAISIVNIYSAPVVILFALGTVIAF